MAALMAGAAQHGSAAASRAWRGLDAERARAASLRSRYREIREALEELQVRAESADGRVTVDMGAGGTVLAITLSEDAFDLSPQALSQVLVGTLNAGMRQVAEQTDQAVRPYVSSASLDLRAITAGRLPELTEPKPDYAEEIEQASAVPKRRLGSYQAEGRR